jgi:hypothetical protein
MDSFSKAISFSSDFDACFREPEMRLLLACCRRIVGTLDEEGPAVELAAALGGTFDEPTSA